MFIINVQWLCVLVQYNKYFVSIVGNEGLVL